MSIQLRTLDKMVIYALYSGMSCEICAITLGNKRVFCGMCIFSLS